MVCREMNGSVVGQIPVCCRSRVPHFRTIPFQPNHPFSIIIHNSNSSVSFSINIRVQGKVESIESRARVKRDTNLVRHCSNSSMTPSFISPNDEKRLTHLESLLVRKVFSRPELVLTTISIKSLAPSEPSPARWSRCRRRRRWRPKPACSRFRLQNGDSGRIAVFGKRELRLRCAWLKRDRGLADREEFN
jgi:hypothetical protein